MSAEPIERGPSTGWQPDPMRQRLAGYTVEDVLNLPPDAPRVELVNGVVLVVPSPTVDHQNISALLWSWLRQHAPEEFVVVQAVGVAVEVNRTYEPDVLLLRRSSVDGRRHYVQPEDVVIAVEVYRRRQGRGTGSPSPPSTQLPEFRTSGGLSRTRSVSSPTGSALTAGTSSPPRAPTSSSSTTRSPSAFRSLRSRRKRPP